MCYAIRVNRIAGYGAEAVPVKMKFYKPFKYIN